MKQALAVVSFGTSVPEARGAVAAVEDTLRACMPDRDFFRAFTSPTIRRIWRDRGEVIPGLPELLADLETQGYEDVLVQPTHLLYGIEYDRLRAAALPAADRFARLTLGKPLLSGTGPLRALAGILAEQYGGEPGAVVFLGHGTAHYADLTYPAMETALRLSGMSNALVGTVEGWPGFDEVLWQLQTERYHRVLLVPMMLVAGDHARNDMAGAGADSWRSRLEARGFSVRCVMTGLGLLQGVQDLYRAGMEALV